MTECLVALGCVNLGESDLDLSAINQNGEGVAIGYRNDAASDISCCYLLREDRCKDRCCASYSCSECCSHAVRVARCKRNHGCDSAVGL